MIENRKDYKSELKILKLSNEDIEVLVEFLENNSVFKNTFIFKLYKIIKINFLEKKYSIINKKDEFERRKEKENFEEEKKIIDSKDLKLHFPQNKPF